MQLVNESGQPLTIEGSTIKPKQMSEYQKLNFIIDSWEIERQGKALSTIIDIAEVLLKSADESGEVDKEKQAGIDDALIMIRSMRLGLKEANEVGHQ